MWNERSFDRAVEKLPKLYSNEQVKTEDQIVHMHLFIGGTDWWITEGDAEEGILFGFCCLDGDWQNAKWGCASIEELKAVGAPVSVIDGQTSKSMGSFRARVDLDIPWRVRKFSEIEAIKRLPSDEEQELEEIAECEVAALTQADYPEWREGKY
jgi:hypothetical protein